MRVSATLIVLIFASLAPQADTAAQQAPPSRKVQTHARTFVANIPGTKRPGQSNVRFEGSVHAAWSAFRHVSRATGDVDVNHLMVLVQLRFQIIGLSITAGRVRRVKLPPSAQSVGAH